MNSMNSMNSNVLNGGDETVLSQRRSTSHMPSIQLQGRMDIENNYAFPLRNGYYKASNHWYTYILVNGSKAMIKASTDTEIEMKIFAGDFGETVPKVAERQERAHTTLNSVMTLDKR